MPQPVPPRQSTDGNDIRGQDPKSNDMSNTQVHFPLSGSFIVSLRTSQALAKNFGVHAAIVNDLKLITAALEPEDLAVGSGGLSSGRDRDVVETTVPRNAGHWIRVNLRKIDVVGLPAIGPGSGVDIWLPKDRAMVKRVVDIYFTRLNCHRPVFVQKELVKLLDNMYDGAGVLHDPGMVCSIYLILALGTLSELSHRACQSGERPDIDPATVKKLMPSDWPDHDELFERALSFKPDLRVTISSLQALILLHWYLYTEVRPLPFPVPPNFHDNCSVAPRPHTLAPSWQPRASVYRARITPRPNCTEGDVY